MTKHTKTTQTTDTPVPPQTTTTPAQPPTTPHDTARDNTTVNESDNLSDSTAGKEGDGEGGGMSRVDRGRLGPQFVCDVICNATAKGSGVRCKNPAVTGSVKCRMHGGASLRGAASPQFKHGRYSKHLPQHLRGDYESARFDKDLLSGREELALLTVRIGDLTARLNFGNSGNLWQELRDSYSALNEAMRSGDMARATACLIGMGQTINAGSDNEGLWSEIRNTCETVNRVRAAENKRQVELRQLITANSAIALVMAIVQIIQRHVTDAATMSGIHREVTALLELEDAETDDEEALEAQPGAATNDSGNEGG